MRYVAVVALVALAGCAPAENFVPPAPPSERELAERAEASRRGLEETRRHREITIIAEASAADRGRLIQQEAELRVNQRTIAEPATARQTRSADWRRDVQREREVIERAVAERSVSFARTTQVAARSESDRQALTICNARGQMVAAQPQYTGPGLAGAIESAAQTSQSGRAVTEICWNTYQQTGVMPGY